MQKDMADTQISGKKLAFSLHQLERKVLPFIDLGTVSAIAKKVELSEAEAMTGIQMLESKCCVERSESEQEFVSLDKLGKVCFEKDLPEIIFLKQVVKEGPVKMSQLSVKGAEFSSALGILKRLGVVMIKKEEELVFSPTSLAKEYLDNYKNPLIQFSEDVLLTELNEEQKNAFETFKQRRGYLKLVVKKDYSFILTEKGKNLLKVLESIKDVELVDALTTDMLKMSSWKGKQFRHYDVGLNVPYNEIGRRHPMMEANNILREIFIEMGFLEMQGPMVESAFWNMDVMWIPQDHPARDEQDPFYIEGDAKLPEDLTPKIKDMHENGIKRTHTIKGGWSEKIAKRRLLRTHSTATTFRTLARLAKIAKEKGEEIKNGKYFYGANNFRNEAVDATHLAEFYQAEGFIIGDDLGLADLMGFVKEFYAKLGLHKIKFKPTYNPYTEPSMEAHYYDENMKKWYALINSGIFRLETLKPLGINKTIIAWGMGSSRVAALLAQKGSMRDITGATCDFEWLSHRPLMTRKIVKK
jgi:phenylalanyl-tRNA synthetase alpha chain